jgi:tripartite-type tricarboxylate transporter receptor subunit TctC
MRANPGKLTSATQGNGTTLHLTSEMFQMMAKGAVSPRALSRLGAGVAGPARRRLRHHVRQPYGPVLARIKTGCGTGLSVNET